MDGFWTWSGRYVGIRQTDYLVSCRGKVLGKFWGNELYNSDGEYIGEVGRNGRLIKNLNKINQRRSIFSNGIRGYINQKFRDYAPYPLLSGYEEFGYEE